MPESVRKRSGFNGSGASAAAERAHQAVLIADRQAGLLDAEPAGFAALRVDRLDQAVVQEIAALDLADPGLVPAQQQRFGRNAHDTLPEHDEQHGVLASATTEIGGDQDAVAGFRPGWRGSAA